MNIPEIITKIKPNNSAILRLKKETLSIINLLFVLIMRITLFTFYHLYEIDKVIKNKNNEKT